MAFRILCCFECTRALSTSHQIVIHFYRQRKDVPLIKVDLKGVTSRECGLPNFGRFSYRIVTSVVALTKRFSFDSCCRYAENYKEQEKLEHRY
eukprot:1180450-Prorocentrum_minimum.AAC.5